VAVALTPGVALVTSSAFVGGCDTGVAASPGADGVPPPAPDATTGGQADGGAGDAGVADAPGVDVPLYPFLDGGADCAVGFSGEPLDLRCTGLYADWPSKTVGPSAAAYAPAFPSWDDGASGPRWIALPPGSSIDTTDMDEWVFPAQTVVWQELRLPLSGADGGVRVETRLLWKQAPGVWYRTTYRWSGDGETSAVEKTGGEANVGGTPYQVPPRVVCDQCHAGRMDGVLGFEAVSLAAPGASGLTLQALVARGVLSAPPASPIAVPGDAVEAAALGWLHANCGTSCHNAGRGPAGLTGLLLRLDVGTLATLQTTGAFVTGWNVLTKSFELGDASTTFRIRACDPGASAAYVRSAERDGVGGVPFGTQMPSVLSHVVDDAGLATFAAWIDEGCDAGP
jgi:hypothetical protein